MTYSFQVIRDCGYGRVWTRLAVDMDDASAEVARWKREGRSDEFINSGSYFIQPIHEVANAAGGFHAEPCGERLAA